MKILGPIVSGFLVLCGLSAVYGQEIQAPQSLTSTNTSQAWAPLRADTASVQETAINTASGSSPAATVASASTTAIDLVRASFQIYPFPSGSTPLPANGVWSVPKTPALAFLAACSAAKASCLEVDYSVPAPKVVCHWTVLFPAPLQVKGKAVAQSPTVINVDSNGAKYTMLAQLQTGMSDSIVSTKAPVYPVNPDATQWKGAVSVDIVVSPAGKVVSIPQARGPALLRASAEHSVVQWVYAPLKLGGQTIARSVTVQVNYSVGAAIKAK